ncbi:hypothetical protein [Bradyrhizobium sp. USDA 3315]
MDFYYENDIKHKSSAKPAFRAIQLATEFAAKKIGPMARVSNFSPLRQKEFMRWCVDKYAHSAGTIARNLSVISAAFKFACKVQIVVDGLDREKEVLLLDSAPNVYTQAKDVAELTALPDSEPRDWLPTLEQLGHFIDAIDVRQENLFRFVILALNTWARPEAILDLRTDKQVEWNIGLIDLNPPGRRQTKKHRPKIRLTENLRGWLKHWDRSAPMTWDDQPITTMKRTFKRHAVACGLPSFTQYTIRHFMATSVRRAKPPVSKEQRDVWLGHDDGRTASWYEHHDPDFLEDARRATEEIIEELQRHTQRPLSTRKLRAKSSIRLIHSKKEAS